MPKSLFAEEDLGEILRRIASLEPDAPRIWGRMTAAQALAHCAAALEAAMGDRPTKQKLIGKLLTPFVRAQFLGDSPFGRDSPTDVSLIISGNRNFQEERRRLEQLVVRFAKRGPGEAEKATHVFIGRLTGAEWGRLMYKHLDHHLRQFSA